MNALIDTNVIVDFLQERQPFTKDSREVVFRATSDYKGYVGASSVTDIYYIHHQHTHNKKRTRKDLASLLKVFDIMDTTNADCRNALHSSIPDFEDAVLVESAIREGINVIVTRNKKDFKNSPIKVCTPTEFLEFLATKSLL